MADGRWQMADGQKLTIIEVGKLPKVAFLFSGIATAPDAQQVLDCKNLSRRLLLPSLATITKAFHPLHPQKANPLPNFFLLYNMRILATGPCLDRWRLLPLPRSPIRILEPSKDARIFTDNLRSVLQFPTRTGK